MELSKKSQSIKLGTYRHFKGTEYKVLGVAIHSETEEEMVIYKHPDQDHFWVRPLAMFTEEVEKPEYNYKGPRFTYIGE